MPKAHWPKKGDRRQRHCRRHHPDGDEDKLPALTASNHGQHREGHGADQLDHGERPVPPLELERLPGPQRLPSARQRGDGVVGEHVRGEAEAAVGERVAGDFEPEGRLVSEFAEATGAFGI